MASIVKVDQIQNADGTVEYLNAGSIKNATLHSSVTGGSGITALGTVASGTLNSSVNINSALSSATFPSGHIIQVKSTTVTDRASSSVSSASGTGGDVGLNVSITPLSSTSHFFIQVYVGIATTTAGNSWCIILSRDGTRVGNGEDTGNHYGVLFRGPDHVGNTGSDVNHGVGGSGFYLDTTSGTIGTSITYKGGLAAESGSAYLNRCEGDYSSASNQVPGSYTQSSITVMEIQQ